MTANNHPLARYRREKGLTQEALAVELDVRPNTIWRWENGERTPRPKDAQRISNITGIDPRDLLAATLQPEAAQ
jgi:transcriptional regulator with XRE-family HTH domain